MWLKTTAFDLEFQLISVTAQLDVIPEFYAVRGISTHILYIFFPNF
jgi:hypothetical protein